MGRLIDADVLIQQIKSCCGGYHQQGYYTCKQDIIDIIEQENTAYDVDKVVEQLESMKTFGVNMLGSKAIFIPRHKAIEIVKAGGGE